MERISSTSSSDQTARRCSWRTAILYTCLYLATFLVADRALGGFLHLVLTRNEVGQRTDPIVALRKAKAEVVIIGNSRARYHYDTTVLQEILGRTVFNAGYDGQTLFYDLATVDLALGTYHPSLVIVDIYPDLLTEQYGDLGGMLVLAPHLNESAVLQARQGSLWEESPAECAGLFFRTPRYRRIAVELIGNSIFTKGTNVGFHPLRARTTENRLNAEAASKAPFSGKLNPRALAYLKEMILLARAAGSKIVFATSPQWHSNSSTYSGATGPTNELREFFRKERVTYVEVTQENLPFFRDPRLYVDTQHLNELGSRVFSVTLGRALAERGLSRRGSSVLNNPPNVGPRN